MLARLRGMPRTRGGLLVVAVLLAGATTASASWHLPGGGVGVAHASIDFHAPSVTAATVAPPGVTGAGGALQPGGPFVVYANVVDPGRLRSRLGAGERVEPRERRHLGVALAVRLRLHGRRCDLRLVDRGADRERRPGAGDAELRRLEPGQRRQPRHDRHALGDRGLDEADGQRRRGGDGVTGHGRLGEGLGHLHRLCERDRCRVSGERDRGGDGRRLGDHARPDGARAHLVHLCRARSAA